MMAIALALPLVVRADSDVARPGNPVIVADRVCVSDEGIHCFEPAANRSVWTALEGRQTLELTYSAGRLFTTGSDGLTAIDSSSGELMWARRDFGAAFPPIARGTSLWLGTRDGHVRRIDARTGAELWDTRLAGWVYTPALSGERLITGGSASVLWALAASNGELLWSRPLAQEIVFSPTTVMDGAVAVATFDGRLRLVSARDGGDLWIRKLGAPTSRVTADAHRIYALLMGGTVTALDRRDGATVWTRHVGGAPRNLTRLNGYLMLWPGTDAVVALDPASGTLHGRAEIGTEVIGAVLPGGLVATRPPVDLRRLHFREPSTMR
ncbi:MAG: PQQ-like beta-propeller repeat protein [Nitrococcus mobilis]|nr:PQQ-like beta-propeller repeat protein [Nitrococcus mobilis]